MRRGSIFIRLLIAFAVIGIMVAVPLIYLSVDFTRTSTERRAVENAAQQMEIIGANFDQELSANLRRSLQFIVSSDVISLFLSASKFEKMIVGEQVETLLLRISEQQEQYSGIYYFDRTGEARIGTEDGRRNALVNGFLSGDKGNDQNPAPGLKLMSEIFAGMRETPLLLASGNMEWFMPPQEVRLGGPFLDKKGRLSLIAALPVIDFDDGSFGGAVFIRQRLDLFVERLGSVRFFDSNPVWLFDDKGNVLLSPDIPKTSFDPRAIMDPAFSEKVRVQTVDRGLLVYRDLAVAPGTRAMRIAFAIRSELLMKDFAPTVRLFLLTLAISIVVVAVFAFFVSRTVSRPIVELAGAAARLAQGDLSARANTNGVGEVQVLVDSFNKMSLNLQIADDNRSRAEKNLIAAMHQAEKANAAKTDFLATMSHEIRTPMNGILGTLNLLRDTGQSPVQRRYIHNIRDSANTLLVILNDILDISKIEAGAVDLEKTDFLLRPMIDATADLMRVRAAEKGLEFVLDAPADLPGAVRGDPVRIRQILTNFISNAVKFTAKGRIGVSIRSNAVGYGKVELLFRITDTGCGIDDKDLETIFDKFSQADTSTTRRYGGTGLGLSISRQLVRMMDGKVSVASTLGKGSEFRFTVICEIGDASNAIDPSDDTGAEIKAAIDPLHILIAEDQPINQEIARDTLERAGHRVDMVSNGREAVEAVSNGHHDIVLMDVHMPEMDGPTATRAIRELDGPRSAIPIIALTADAMVGAREAILASGMNAYVSKPFKPAELFGALARFAPDKTTGIPSSQPADEQPGETARSKESPELPPIDPEVADPFRRGKPKLWQRIIGMFIDTTPELIADLDHAVVQQDAPAVRAGAHSLKSISANIGALALSNLGRELEEIAKTGDFAAMSGLRDSIVPVHAEVMALLKSEREEVAVADSDQERRLP